MLSALAFMYLKVLKYRMECVLICQLQKENRKDSLYICSGCYASNPVFVRPLLARFDFQFAMKHYWFYCFGLDANLLASGVLSEPSLKVVIYGHNLVFT